MTHPSTLAPVHATAATALRRLAHTGEPLHPQTNTKPSPPTPSKTHNDLGDWGSFDDPGHAHTAHDLAVLIRDHHS